VYSSEVSAVATCLICIFSLGEYNTIMLWSMDIEELKIANAQTACLHQVAVDEVPH
jgi:hypothetical protein